MDVFLEISLILGVATVVAAIMQLLRQPLIIGHIISGLLVGPAVLDLVHSTETVELFSHIGIALLLFIIGLGLNPKIIREVGKIAVLTGVGQILFTSAIGTMIALSLGFSTVSAVYIGAGLAFSSTIIILKLLSDKKDTHRLYGKIATGFLLVQDIVAVLILIAVTALGQDQSIAGILVQTFGVGVLFIIAIALISHFILPRLGDFLARSQEFLFLFSVGWGFMVSAIAYYIGFSIEIGALAAGVALAGSPYANEISSRMRPLRDFFIVLFFIVLGAELDIANIGAGLLPAIALSIFILIGNPVIVMSIMGLLRFTRKTSFKAGLTVAQISEFSLILMLLARDVGHIDNSVVSMVTLVGLITIAASTYMITYSDKLYDWLSPHLRIFERRSARSGKETDQEYDIILFGFKAGSRSLIEGFEKLGRKYLVIDYDPEVVDLLAEEGVPCLFGDANDTEFLEELPIDKMKLAVVAATDYTANSVVIGHIRQRNPGAVVVAKAEEPHEAQELYDQGADYVMMPHYLGAQEIAKRIVKHDAEIDKHLARVRKQHLQYLSNSYK